jgi:lysozyme
MIANKGNASGSNIYNDLAAFLKKVEEDNKAALTSYDDGEGTWTIGWGSIYNYDENRSVEEGDTITQEQADRYLRIEATKNLQDVNDLVKVPLNKNQQIALASFVYNEGIGAFQSSTLLKQLNQGILISQVADQFDRWIYANGHVNNGLVNRRAAEKKLFLS